MTDQLWTVRRTRLRTTREPGMQAYVAAHHWAPRIIELDPSVWPDELVDPYDLPLVQAIVERAEHCRAFRLTHGPDHLSLNCHRVAAPPLRVLPGGGERERRVDAG